MIIAVDFDGTIVKNKWPEIGKPRFLSFPVLKWIKKRGHIVTLWTCRAKERQAEAIGFMMVHGVMPDYINDNAPERIKEYGSDCRKIAAEWYIDDKAGFLGWWSIPIIILWLEWRGKKYAKQKSRSI